MSVEIDARWSAALAVAQDPGELERAAALVAFRLVRSGLRVSAAVELARATVLNGEA